MGNFRFVFWDLGFEFWVSGLISGLISGLVSGLVFGVWFWGFGFWVSVFGFRAGRAAEGRRPQRADPPPGGP